jgi:SAM-dependent methyltransferase
MKESNIRPPDLLQKYLELCNEDAERYFGRSLKKDIPCPACDSGQEHHAFEKWGYGYVVCDNCGTLYQSPRPPREDFALFYLESPSSRYWTKTFFPAVAEARRISLFRPKVEEIAQLCQNDEFAPTVLADIGAGYGLLLEEWRRKFPETELIAIEPNPDLAEICRLKKIKVAECFAEEATDLRGQVDLAVALEVIEHVHDPMEFCCSLRQLVQDGGKVLLTGLTVDGFDIQVLWNRSKSVCPPHHINFMSVSGFEHLLRRAGFSSIRIFTPGKLDVDIVRNSIAEKPDIVAGQRFIAHLMKRGEKVLQAFQEFLREHQLSSHCWVWATK